MEIDPLAFGLRVHYHIRNAIIITRWMAKWSKVLTRCIVFLRDGAKSNMNSTKYTALYLHFFLMDWNVLLVPILAWIAQKHSISIFAFAGFSSIIFCWCVYKYVCMSIITVLTSSNAPEIPLLVCITVTPTLTCNDGSSPFWLVYL